MDVDAFLERVSGTDIRLSATVEAAQSARSPEALDALFHLPLLALITMVIARRKPFRTMILGRNVASLLVEHFSALRNSPHSLETSLTLRRRCADALAFLEAAGLVTVSDDSQRIVSLSDEGKKQFNSAITDRTDLGLLIRQLRINQERVLVRAGDDR
jgi:hypothetical protein